MESVLPPPTRGARPARASVLRPQELAPNEADLVPAPPPMDTRPRNASYENMEAKLDAMETLAKELEFEKISQGQPADRKSRRQRASVLSKQDVEPELRESIPAPPDAPRPQNADDYNYATEVALRQSLLAKEHAASLPGTILERAGEEQSGIIAFPLPKHSYEVVMERHRNVKSLVGLTAERIAIQMESVLFSSESVQRAVGWLPSPGDVIISAAPRCGQSLVVLMVRLLCAKDDKEIHEILSVPTRTAPWVECALMDEDPQILERDQPGTNRIFRTTMTHSMLSAKMDKVPGAKFIFVARNPLDMRIAWFDHLKAFFVKHQCAFDPRQGEKEWGEYFNKHYSPDDISNTPITMVQNTFHTTDHLREYEFNVKQWVNDARHKNILVIFLEEVLSMPEKTLRKIAAFLGREETMKEEHFERVLDETTGKKILQISRRNSQLLTPDQMALIKVKFGADHADSDDEPTVFETGPKEPRKGPLPPRLAAKKENRDLLEMFESSARNISARGIFTDISRKLDEARGVRRSELRSDLAVGSQRELTPRTFEILQQRWADTFQSRAPTYEDLYESVVKEPYPSLSTAIATTGKGLRGGPKFFATNDGSQEKGPRRTLISRMFSSGEEARTISEEPASEGSGSDQGISPRPTQSARRTLRMKVFGSSGVKSSAKTSG